MAQVRDLNQSIFNSLRAFYSLVQEDVLLFHPPKTDNFQTDHFISPSVDPNVTVRSTAQASFYTPSQSNLTSSTSSYDEPPPPPPPADAEEPTEGYEATNNEFAPPPPPPDDPSHY